MISRLTRLETFIQSGGNPAGWSRLDENFLYLFREWRRVKAEEWFQNIPRFRTAYFQESSIENDRCFIAWECNVPGARNVDVAEVWNISPWL
jgi:hypothetical protein